MGRLAVIGDVGGHWRPLMDALAHLGVDVKARRIPADLQICSVGDLVHRGPASAAVVRTVDAFIRNNPGQWHQVAGNHEAQYLFAPRFEWPERLDADAAATLRRWWADGSMQLAAAFTTEGVQVRRRGGIREVVGTGGLLVTHAGLTAGLWKQLGAPGAAAEAAEAINAQRFDEDAPVWAPGRMLGGGHPHWNAGVAWAEADGEVYEGWRRADSAPGFHQAHGHSSAVLWPSGRWRLGVQAWQRYGTSRASATVDPLTRIVRAEVCGQVLWGCDPGHGKSPVESWAPLVLTTPDHA